jgi:imidazole glycerol-phosphate synthase subunit HisH
VIVIVDYGLGNLASILNMLRKIGAQARISSDPGVIDSATKLLLPGVGSFDSGMAALEERGLVPVLSRKVLDAGTPLLGLCLGMQLLTRGSEEGRRPGLGWIDATTVRFRFPEGGPRLPVPHMGWNGIRVTRESPLLAALPDPARFYFVHSYHVVCGSEDQVLATTSYGYDFPSVIGRGRLVGTQFHPEKSHKFGMALLRSFVLDGVRC